MRSLKRWRRVRVTNMVPASAARCRRGRARVPPSPPRSSTSPAAVADAPQREVDEFTELTIGSPEETASTWSRVRGSCLRRPPLVGASRRWRPSLLAQDVLIVFPARRRLVVAAHGPQLGWPLDDRRWVVVGSDDGSDPLALRGMFAGRDTHPLSYLVQTQCNLFWGVCIT